MPQSTDRLGLPLLAAGQAQKEITHNEALIRADTLIQASVESAVLSTPPALPQSGQCWIIAAGASGSWTGKSGQIAAWTSGGWVFLEPKAGWRVMNLQDNHELRHDGTSWSVGEVTVAAVIIANHQVLGPQQAGIAAPSGGTLIDSEARIALNSILAALRSHGLIAV